MVIDVEENPGPFTQISNDENAPYAKQVNIVHYWNYPDHLNLVEFQSMYWEMETVLSVRYHAS